MKEDRGYNGNDLALYVREAVRCGNVEFLVGLCALAQTEGHHDIFITADALKNILRNKELCTLAAQHGHLRTLQWLRSQVPPCPWDEETCLLAATFGHLDVLEWARSQDPRCPWDERMCSWAASNGHLELLKWARVQDPPCPWDDWTCSFAAGRGYLNVLTWARSQDPPCPWDIDICQSQALRYPEVLQWLQSQSDTMQQPDW